MPEDLKVSRGEIVSRCLHGCCPDCGEKLPPGAPWSFPMACPECGMVMRRHDGFFLGALVLNYGMVAFGALPVPLMLFQFRLVSKELAVGAALAFGLLLPLLLYRTAWKLWLALHYGCLPLQLPANAGDAEVDD